MASPEIIDKRSLQFVAYDECRTIAFDGNWTYKDGHAIGMDDSASLRIVLENVSLVYAVFSRHDWSGKIKVSVNGRESDCFELYSSYHFRQCLPLVCGSCSRKADIRISILGRSPSSQGTQMVFDGILLPRDEAAGVARAGKPARAEPPQAPQEFSDVQVHMVDRYTDSLIERGVSLEDEARRRWTKYAMRFREALVYAAPGARLLDIGAGFLTADFIREVIAPVSVDYWAHDIDGRAIEHDKGVLAECGLDASHARQGLNTELPYADSSFDLVFSSHCLEHSDDIDRTLLEIRRILKSGGYLFFAVPIGYDPSVEHIYAMDVDGWKCLVQRHAFEVVNEHVGSIYAEGRHDLVIVGRRN